MKLVVKKVISGLLKIIVVYKEVEAYEEQGILEDIDSDCGDSADGTDHHAGSIQLYVNKKGAKGLTFCALSSLFPLGDGFAHLLQQVAGEDEVGEALVGGVHDLRGVALPLLVALVDVDDVLADAHHRVHIVGVDDGRHVEFAGDGVQQVVDDQ